VIGVKHAVAFVALAVAVAFAAGTGLVVFADWGGDEGARASAPSTSRSSVSNESTAEPSSVLEGLEQRLKVKIGSKKTRGEFALRGGRRLRVHTADTTDRKSCLLDVQEPAEIAGAMCLENGLFGLRKAAFSVSSNGGPARFGELYLLGVAAPGIATVSVSKTDGSTVDVQLNRDHAFLFQSTPSDLEQDILPSGLRLFGSGGKLVEMIEIPSLR
jgi:hypothetical protein